MDGRTFMSLNMLLLLLIIIIYCYLLLLRYYVIINLNYYQLHLKYNNLTIAIDNTLVSSNIIQTNYSTENIKRNFKVVLEKKTEIKKFKVNNYPSNKIIKILKKAKFPISMLKNFTIQ